MVRPAAGVVALVTVESGYYYADRDLAQARVLAEHRWLRGGLGSRDGSAEAAKAQDGQHETAKRSRRQGGEVGKRRSHERAGGTHPSMDYVHGPSPVIDAPRSALSRCNAAFSGV